MCESCFSGSMNRRQFMASASALTAAGFLTPGLAAGAVRNQPRAARGKVRICTLLGQQGQPDRNWNICAEDFEAIRARLDAIEGKLGNVEFVTGHVNSPDEAANLMEEAGEHAPVLAISSGIGWLHIWMWGKGAGGDFNHLPGGYDGARSQRINRYIAARLGPVPGWSMGIGWDVEFWTHETQIAWWLNDIIPQLGGWHHWIGVRYSDSDIGEGRDPEPANEGQYLERGIRWNTLRPGDEQYAGWEHWRTTTSDSEIEAGLEAFPDRPMMSEDRFRRRDDAWPQKDMHSDDEILDEIPRWASRGVAAIYGRLIENSSDIWPNKAAIKSVIDALDEQEGNP